MRAASRRYPSVRYWMIWGEVDAPRQLQPDAGKLPARAAYATRSCSTARLRRPEVGQPLERRDRRDDLDCRPGQPAGLHPLDAPARTASRRASTTSATTRTRRVSRSLTGRPTRPVCATSTTSTPLEHELASPTVASPAAPPSCGCRSSRSPPITQTGRLNSRSAAPAQAEWVTGRLQAGRLRPPTSPGSAGISCSISPLRTRKPSPTA